jgi:hypothetical protein
VQERRARLRRSGARKTDASLSDSGDAGLLWQVADHGTFSPVVKASGGNRKALRIAAAGAAIVLALTAVAAVRAGACMQ